MNKAIERATYDKATGAVIVTCHRPNGEAFQVQVDFDAAEAIVQAFRDAMPEPALGLDDSGVYSVHDLRLTSTEDRMLLDVWIQDGRKARFVFTKSIDSWGDLERIADDLQHLLLPTRKTYSH